MEWCSPLGVCSIDLGTSCEKCINSRRASIQSGNVQRHPFIFICLVRKPRKMIQTEFNGISVVATGCIENIDLLCSVLLWQLLCRSVLSFSFATLPFIVLRVSIFFVAIARFLWFLCAKIERSASIGWRCLPSDPPQIPMGMPNLIPVSAPQRLEFR